MKRLCLLSAVVLAALALTRPASAEPFPKASKTESGSFSWDNAIIHLEISGK
jgi:hypothetical protein